MITAQMVKELREMTGAGMMDCKKALNECEGNIQKSVELLREKGLAAAAKKAGRIASEGLVKTYVSENKKEASIVEVNCETDFVSVNEAFVEFVDNVAKQAASTTAEDIDAFVEEKYIADPAITIKEALTNLIAKLGENMSVRRFQKFTVDNGTIESYIHGGGRIGVLVKLECAKEDEVLRVVAKDLAMQVAASNPLFLSRNDVDQDTIEKEKEIYKVQAMNEGKPENIAEKMTMGRIQKYFKEICLLEQVWIKDTDYTITKLLQEKSSLVGSEISVAAFVRFERGEGLAKKEDNFAEEVQKQAQMKK
ncbi:MAG: translation elongation factor Ts [Clostridiaceae bacterium]